MHSNYKYLTRYGPLTFLWNFLVFMILFPNLSVCGMQSLICEANDDGGACEAPQQKTTQLLEDDAAIEREIIRQVEFSVRAHVEPVTAVIPLLGIGKGVLYFGDKPLPVGTTVGLYRALLVQKDVWMEWLKDGTITPGVWESFWRRYAVEFTNEIGETDTNEKEEDRTSWMALPVGDVGAGLDDPTWWTHGVLSKNQLRQAIQSINEKQLVDWERLAASHDGKSLHFFNAHILNEPSAGYDGHNDETENVGHLTGSGCSAFNREGERHKWCGTAFEAKTSRIVDPGEQLLWCYGEGYIRNYQAAMVCLDDKIREGEL